MRNTTATTRQGVTLILLAVGVATPCCGYASPGTQPLAGRTFFVSAASGDDHNDGLSPQSPWRSLAKVNAAPLRGGDQVRFRRGEVWRGQLVPQSGQEGKPIRYGAYGEGNKPLLLGSVSRSDPADWQHEGANIWATADELALDVGNIVFDRGRSVGVKVGVKKWSATDLKQQGDYWYDAQNWQVRTYSVRNPAELYKSIELALRRHIIDQSNKGHIVYEDLALRYGAAHGIGGSSTHHIVLRNCDLSYIGGGHQFTTAAGRPVRFGNGIEFWSDAHDNLVEGCRIWEVYDAALTNQGDGVNVQRNITYRDNVIWNCEYSFEYWNRGEKSVTQDIRFEHNTCVNAGFGWGHTQRPDPNGRHLMFYFNAAQTSEFHVRHNIFSSATESGMWMQNDWNAGLSMDRNCWHQPRGPLMQFLKASFTPAQFVHYRKQTGLDAHSIVADPKFLDLSRLDFRLADDSLARTLSATNGSVGAQKRLAE